MAKKRLTDLQTQIENIHNPRDFERLVNELFSRIYGTDYIASANYGDAGLDGYIKTSKTIVAKHCFENLSNASKKSKVLKKTREDLKKLLHYLRVSILTCGCL